MRVSWLYFFQTVVSTTRLNWLSQQKSKKRPSASVERTGGRAPTRPQQPETVLPATCVQSHPRSTMPGAYGVVDHPAPAPRIDVSEKRKTGVIIENDRAQWRSAWRQKLSSVLDTPAASYTVSAQRLSTLVRTGLLKFTDLTEKPAKFFEAHRLLAQQGFDHGPGFSIRFTVQYNLFAGTVLELGGHQHLKQLQAMQSKGTLGCFALTERLAGVNSGLVVHTTATWIVDPTDKTSHGYFSLNTPHSGAKKNWISQGLTAEFAVVVADLLVDSKSKGPHAFLVRLRESKNGRPLRGITLTDMGQKTTGNDLDNASIAFVDVKLDRKCLLDKHCDVFAVREGRELKGVYVERTGEIIDPGVRSTTDPTLPTQNTHKTLTNMDRIGQRLFTGRVAVAQGAHEFRTMLFSRTKQVTDAKPCWVPSKGVSRNGLDTPATRALSDVPQLKSLYLEEERKCQRTGQFLQAVESNLCASLLSKQRPGKILVEAVAAAKVRAVDEAIEMTHRLRQEVGSYALMQGTGFEHTDFLQCCKFAEGDSRVLMMKMARDRVIKIARNGNKNGAAAALDSSSQREASAVAKLALALQNSAGKGSSQAEAWDEASELAYQLAEIAIEDIVRSWLEPTAKL